MFARPLSTEQSTAAVETWLSAPQSWVPATSDRTVPILRRLLVSGQLVGNLVTDAQLAALAIEHGIPVVSADSDFARFTEVRWVNPLA